ncbi:MAG: phosphatase PAP2 family protein [Arcobacteraceae bacterium]
MFETIRGVDLFFLKFFHTVKTKYNDKFFAYITWLGSLWVLIPLWGILTVVLANMNLQHLIFPFYVGFVGAIATTYALKYTFDRQRPHKYKAIGEIPFDPSFPSAHTTQIFIVTFLIVILFFNVDFEMKYVLSGISFMVAVIVAMSRMYLQVHYFSDVIVGFAVATLWAYIGYSLVYK